MSFIGSSHSRVEDHTDPVVNHRIADETGGVIAYYEDHPEEIDLRLAELDEEWDIERWLQLNSAAISLFGLGMSLVGSKKWLALPVAVQGFFMQHGVQGWCPPLPMFRRMGIRTTREIEAERNALLELRDEIDAKLEEVENGKAHEDEDGEHRALRRLRESRLENIRRAENDGAFIAPTRQRVRERTPDAINEQLDQQTERRVAYYSRHPERAHRRLTELEQEWDIERVIEVHGPTLSLSGIALGLTRGRRWLALPILVQSMMAMHALNGFYPPLTLMRKMGLRTLDEIEAERAAILMALGEFDEEAEIESAHTHHEADLGARA